MSMTRSMCSRPSMRSTGAASTRAPLRRVPEQRVDDERRLARAGYAGDAGEEPERDVGADVAQVVAARADDVQLPRRICDRAQPRHVDAAPPRQVLAG